MGMKLFFAMIAGRCWQMQILHDVLQRVKALKKEQRFDEGQPSMPM
jgi:hypothetical protein